MGETNGDGRDKAGRFALGNRGGPGRPRREVEAEYLAATLANVNAETWGRIVAKAALDAEAGDDRARSFLARILGLYAPARASNPDADRGPTLVELLARAAELPHPPAPEGWPSNVIDVDKLPVPPE